MNKKYEKLNILVTGGAGFIGSHLVEKLVECKVQVTVLDNLSTGSLDNLFVVKNDIEFIEGSIIDFDLCLKASKNKDIIFHLAAYICAPQSLLQPYECNQANIFGMNNVLEAARINRVSRFIFSSSSAVYGKQNGYCSEDASCRPESPYGFSKLMGEYLCQHYSALFGIQTICLRYFNVFGNRQKIQGSYAAVVAQFKQAMQQNKPITIYGDGLQTRDFVPVDQIVKANMQLAQLPASLMNGDVYNIGTGKSITILELIEQLRKEFPDFTAGIQFVPARDGDIKYSGANCSKFKKAISELEFD